MFVEGMNPWQNGHILLFGMWLVWFFWLLILYQFFTSYVTFIYFFCKEKKLSQFKWSRSFLVCITGKSKIGFWLQVQLEPRGRLMSPGFWFFLCFFPPGGGKWFLAILGLHFPSQYLILEGDRTSAFSFIVHICFWKGTLALPGLCTLLWTKHCVWADGREKDQPRTHTLPWVV